MVAVAKRLRRSVVVRLCAGSNPVGHPGVGSRVGKVQIVIVDREGSSSFFDAITFQRFFGYVLGNPSIRASGHSEEEVTGRITSLLLIKEKGLTKVVEVDVAADMLAQSVMES